MLGSVLQFAGGLLGAKSTADANKANIQHQKQFAKQGIQWKVADAEKAGVHPLFALGANTHSFAPSSVGDTSLPTALQNMGQSVDRAVTSTQDKAAQAPMQALLLERAGLENDLLRSKIAQINQVGSSPGIPTPGSRYLIDGQGDAKSSLIQNTPMERVVSAPENPAFEPGAVTDQGFARTASGGLAPVYSKDVKERLEDDTLGMFAWNLRNRAASTVGAGVPPPVDPGPGKQWSYDVLRQQWIRVNKLFNPFKGGRYPAMDHRSKW